VLIGSNLAQLHSRESGLRKAYHEQTRHEPIKAIYFESVSTKSGGCKLLPCDFIIFQIF